ncbi:hypothetical protein [Thermoactinomyces sp. CICC 10521]|uniref:hypothetical protein n=1 Tax=Thermoactinomyces sp. CICC 10521 TaxID=2767426 RepID=UPI0018DCDD81|nr:hypothetical protein [Thermoactinomyces sp. CICC 10521]MBH8608922.1 hypothetical protein [Thermoactinomyces sp. CICC 10521]
MKVLKYSLSRFGKGTNPGGGVFVKVLLETKEEAEFFQAKRFESLLIKERLVKHVANLPMDGGPNPQWDRLMKWVAQTGKTLKEFCEEFYCSNPDKEIYEQYLLPEAREILESMSMGGRKILYEPPAGSPKNYTYFISSKDGERYLRFTKIVRDEKDIWYDFGLAQYIWKNLCQEVTDEEKAREFCLEVLKGIGAV